MKLRSTTSMAAVVVAMASIGLAACQGEIGDPPAGPDEPSPTAKSEHPDGHHHPMEVDWMTVEDLPRMIDASHVVVRGRVVEQRTENQVLYPWSEEKGRYLTAEEAGDEVTEVPWTISTVLVADVVHARGDAVATGGTGVARASVVEIAELGGRLRCGCDVHPGDKPVLQPSQEAFLFLSHAKGGAGRYHVVGGWQGRFDVTERGLRALAVDVHPGAREFARFDGVDIDAFVVEVKTLASR